MWKDPRSFWDDYTLNLRHIDETKKNLPLDCRYRAASLYPAELLFRLWKHSEQKEELLKKESFCSCCLISQECDETEFSDDANRFFSGTAPKHSYSFDLFDPFNPLDLFSH